MVSKPDRIVAARVPRQRLRVVGAFCGGLLFWSSTSLEPSSASEVVTREVAPMRRPWKEVDAGALRRRIDDAAGEAQVAAAQEALRRGYFAEVVRVAPDPASMGSAWMDLLGLAPADGGPEPREAARYTQAPPKAGVSLRPISEKDRKVLLKGRYRDMRLVNKSTYFDLWSDLSAEEIQPYTDLLNAYYRGLRNRFRTDLSGSIDVVLFGNRADYLVSYARSFRESGENVLGFYVPALRRLVFYDDPVERVGISLTARHECTHLLVDLSLKGAPVPPWLNEGLACFFAAGEDQAAGEYTAGLIRTIQARMSKARVPALPDLMNVLHKDFTYEHYAWAWSLIHFLNRGDRARGFREFFMELRDRLDPEMSDHDAREVVGAAFTSAFGKDTSAIEAEWVHFLEHELELERTDQVLDYALRSLREARSAERDVARMLDEAEACFWSVVHADEPALTPEAEMGRLETMVVRANVEGLDLDGALLLLRTLVVQLEEVPVLIDEGRKGRLIREALDAAAKATRLGRSRKEGTFDFRAALVQAADRAVGADHSRLAALVVLQDELLEIGFRGLAAALAEDPLSRTAATEWLYLAFCHAPARTREVFDHLLLLVDREPDDRNRAALGVAYFALGKEAFGKRMVQQAEESSFQPGVLALAKELVGAK